MKIISSACYECIFIFYGVVGISMQTSIFIFLLFLIIYEFPPIYISN